MKALNTFKAPLFTAICAASLLLTPAAQAVTLTYSETTQKVAPWFKFEGDYNLPFNLFVKGHVGFAPDLSSFINPLPASQSSSSGLAAEIDRFVNFDALADANLNLGYRFQLFDVDALVGHIQGNISPYAGYRHIWTFTGTLSNQTYTQMPGLHYGAQFNLGLPLGFTGYAYGEATTLLGGSFEQGGVSQPLQSQGQTLPGFGVGVNWQLPFLNLASAYVGYNGFFLPTDLRKSATLSGEQTLVHGVSLGASVLWFGI